ncbi:alpha-L-rhamnosidase-related protein [Saccharicrinis sp. GN24d3]|uniref:alpha-L-rhamnosidase-related protein n=1 Tax=Saccharicrinis sp. GN24d3 TaxID=3458416 RepID=UPI004035A3F5
MKLIYYLSSSLLVFLAFSCSRPAEKEAQWITVPGFEHAENQWFQIRKEIKLKKQPETAIATIAADSKYWLWINGELAVLEGQLKRGPNPSDTYFDEIDLAPWLKKGKNTIAVQLWYFGCDGFSHKDSKMAGFYFNCVSGKERIVSDLGWKIRVDSAYQDAGIPRKNFRLPESNVRFVATQHHQGWQLPGFDDSKWRNAVEIGKIGTAPWNDLVKRPIPQWKDFGLTKVTDLKRDSNRVAMKLPYNMQFHFWLKVKSDAGKQIEITTDNFYNLNDIPLRAEYETKGGVQEYEHLPWLNGEEVYFDLEEGVEILEAGYRETGYNSEFDGEFKVDDADLMTLLAKAERTLYVTMRDNFMDCPDRERAQWWGDLVLEMEETFYAMDNTAIDLSRKAIYELVDWQKPDSTLFSPIPAGNWDKELPQQMLASIGWFGFRHYVQYTGEQVMYNKVFPAVKEYLSKWQVGEDGSVPFKKGGWNWADWGGKLDKTLLEHVWYYLALKGYAEMAEYVNEPGEKNRALEKMERVKNHLNSEFWTKQGYRSPNYKKETDDRGNGLAVVAGIADPSKYPVLRNLLFETRHSSPYMEKYVEEALFVMGETELALTRMKERYKPMIDSEHSTLWEIFHDGNWSHNHAWSGGPLSLMYKYLAGIEPEKPGFSEFHVFPEPGNFKSMSCSFSTVKGKIKLDYDKLNTKISYQLVVPDQSSAIIRIPKNNKDFKVQGERKHIELVQREDNLYKYFKLESGSWEIVVDTKTQFNNKELASK